jgi:hypothetical protein
MPPTILRCHRGVFTEPLPSNNGGVTQTLKTPLIQHKLHRKRCVRHSSNVACIFITTGTFIPSHCLAMIYTQTWEGFMKYAIEMVSDAMILWFWVTLKWGFGLEIGFIDHFNTWLVTTLNYSTITDLHNLQITTAHAKSFQSTLSSPVVAS